MRERDELDTDLCVVCGEEVDLEDPRSFFRTAAAVACFECARKYGGIYDTVTEKWKVPPRLPPSHVRRHEKDL